MRNFLISTPPDIIRASNRELDGRSMQHVWGRRDVNSVYWCGNLREGNHLEDPGVDGRMILRWAIQEVGWGAWAGLIWMWIGTGGGLL